MLITPKCPKHITPKFPILISPNHTMFITHKCSIAINRKCLVFIIQNRFMIITQKCTVLIACTAQKMMFSIRDFFSKCNQICRFRRVWSHLLKKSVMENFIFCAAMKMCHTHNSNCLLIIWKKSPIIIKSYLSHTDYSKMSHFC